MKSRIEDLANEVERIFPLIDIPSPAEIPHHLHGCVACERLIEDVEMLRNRQIGGEEIRQLHQEMTHLSAKAWQWILPHYLRYCFTPEADCNKFETEFLVYNLSPLREFEIDTKIRLSLVADDQILALVDFLAYLSSIEYWKMYCPAELQRGISFLRNIVDERAVKPLV